MEVLWLLNRLAPDFKTIANFRVDNHAAVGRVCQAFVQFCRSQALIGGELVAIDGSRFHADNSPAKVTWQADLTARLDQVSRGGEHPRRAGRAGDRARSPDRPDRADAGAGLARPTGHRR